MVYRENSTCSINSTGRKIHLLYEFVSEENLRCGLWVNEHGSETPKAKSCALRLGSLSPSFLPNCTVLISSVISKTDFWFIFLFFDWTLKNNFQGLRLVFMFDTLTLKSILSFRILFYIGPLIFFIFFILYLESNNLF